MKERQINKLKSKSDHRSRKVDEQLSLEDDPDNKPECRQQSHSLQVNSKVMVSSTVKDLAADETIIDADYEQNQT